MHFLCRCPNLREVAVGGRRFMRKLWMKPFGQETLGKFRQTDSAGAERTVGGVSSDGMTWAQVRETEAWPEMDGRTSVYAHEIDGGYEAVWDGGSVRGSNMFLLDSRLSDSGAPAPRNLFLVRRDEWEGSA